MTSPVRPGTGPFAPEAVPDTAGFPSLDNRSELDAGRKSLRFSRFMGRLSGLVFLIAALAVVDGLQTLVRHEFNEVSIIPGETIAVSGMMPQDASGLSDLRVEMEGLSGLTFTPVDAFKGFWMGGNMWRAELKADTAAAPGKGTITVVDMVPLKKVGRTAIRDTDTPSPPPVAPEGTGDEAGDKAGKDAPQLPEGTILGQNPALIYSVVLWPSEAARKAAEHSFARRLTGIQPFWAAGIAAACALLCAIANSLFFSRAEARLARHGVYFIHGIKKQPSGLQAAFAHAGQNAFLPGDAVLLYDMRGRRQGKGSIAGKDAVKGFALFPFASPPRYAWLVALEHEGEIPAPGPSGPGHMG